MPTSRFEAEVQVRAGIAVVSMRGDIDREAESGLASAYLAADGAPVILLDFTSVGYINSTGIAVVSMRGDIDREAESGLASAYLAADGAPVIRLDFTSVGYINSTGIAVVSMRGD